MKHRINKILDTITMEDKGFHEAVLYNELVHARPTLDKSKTKFALRKEIHAWERALHKAGQRLIKATWY